MEFVQGLDSSSLILVHSVNMLSPLDDDQS